MTLLLKNALFADIDPVRVEPGDLRIDGNRIIERGPLLEPQPGETIHDCQGALVLPGLVNGHTHLYSALAAGMPMPAIMPTNFHEVLKFIWWRLDRALDEESIIASGRIGALDALHCGTTTLIDHHASPDCIDGSLDMIESGVGGVGLRLIQCYEVTERNGKQGRIAGLAENQRYLEKLQPHTSNRFAALVGAHASFTCDDETMQAMAEMARKFNTGVHIHVAEDPIDEKRCLEDHNISLIKRLEKFDMLNADCVYGHCTHLDDEAIEMLNAAGTAVGHNTRSNMNNSVGYAPLHKIKAPVQLGTDGIGADMFEEARTAWFKACDAKAGLAPADVVGMLANSARRASRSLGVTLGKLQAGAAADIVITDYQPATPINTDNFLAHFLFAMAARHVQHVIIDGQWALKNRTTQTTDEESDRTNAQQATQKMWDRLVEIE